MEAQNKLTQALKIREFHNSLSIGYNGAPDCNSLVGPEPFRLHPEELRLLSDQGELFRQWLQISADLCTRSLRDERLQWLGELIEGESSDQVKDVHRRVHLSGRFHLPLFARPDMSAVGSTVEVQMPGSGWGYQAAIHNTVSGSCWEGPVEAFKQAVETVCGPDAPAAYVLYNSPFQHEVEYFCRLCKDSGMLVNMHFQSLPSPTEVGFVRRPPLEDILSYDGADKLIEAWLKGEVFLEPGPSLLFDQKLAVLFPFHPELRQYYPDSIRGLFPETYLVTKQSPAVFDGHKIDWDELCALPKSKRQFILKYAGSKKGLRAGGRAVYNLSECNHQKTEELVTKALSDWENLRSPWLIQKRVQKKYPITFLNHVAGRLEQADYYAIFRPMYSFLPNQTARIVSCTGLFRKEWKVHGSSDAVILPVEP